MYLKKMFVGWGLVLGLLLSSGSTQAALYNTLEDLQAAPDYAADPRFESVGWLAGHGTVGDWAVAGAGVVIDPWWILTAGHCLTRLDDTGFSDMYFSLSSSIYTEPPNYIQATQWIPYPGYSGLTAAGYGDDIGLVKLSQPITGIAPAILFDGEDQLDTVMHMAGHGQPGTRASGPQTGDGVKRAGNNVAEWFGHIWEDQYWVADLDYAQFPECQPLEWQSTRGDSGGGWFADINGQSQLVGINSFSSGSYVYSGAIRVSLYTDWIYATIPEPSTVILLVVGSLGLMSRRRIA